MCDKSGPIIQWEKDNLCDKWYGDNWISLWKKTSTLLSNNNLNFCGVHFLVFVCVYVLEKGKLDEIQCIIWKFSGVNSDYKHVFVSKSKYLILKSASFKNKPTKTVESALWTVKWDSGPKRLFKRHARLDLAFPINEK